MVYEAAKQVMTGQKSAGDRRYSKYTWVIRLQSMYSEICDIKPAV